MFLESSDTRPSSLNKQDARVPTDAACYIAGTIAPAVRPPVHDVTDGSALRSWLNSPLSSGLAADIYSATNILHSFAQVGRLQPERSIPAAVLSGAVGFAILSVAKVNLLRHLRHQLLALLCLSYCLLLR